MTQRVSESLSFHSVCIQATSVTLTLCQVWLTSVSTWPSLAPTRYARVLCACEHVCVCVYICMCTHMWLILCINFHKWCLFSCRHVCVSSLLIMSTCHQSSACVSRGGHHLYCTCCNSVTLYLQSNHCLHNIITPSLWFLLCHGTPYWITEIIVCMLAVVKECLLLSGTWQI